MSREVAGNSDFSVLMIHSSMLSKHFSKDHKSHTLLMGTLKCEWVEDVSVVTMIWIIPLQSRKHPISTCLSILTSYDAIQLEISQLLSIVRLQVVLFCCFSA